MFLHITSLTIEADFGYGFLFKISSFGGSVARASAPNVSITRFTQSICTAFSGESLRIADPKKTIAIAVILTDNQNCKNFLTLSQTFLPYLRATTIDEKLSSSKIISEAPLAISVPVIPMEKPTSAFLRAGASLVPSPVTATTPYYDWIPVTRINLSRGDDLAKTLRYLNISLN